MLLVCVREECTSRGQNGGVRFLGAAHADICGPRCECWHSDLLIEEQVFLTYEPSYSPCDLFLKHMNRASWFKFIYCI